MSVSMNRFRIVTYDLKEFVEEANPEYPIRYEIRVRKLGEYLEAVYVRLSGITKSGNVIEYREKRVFRIIDTEAMKSYINQWNEVLSKLNARPGRYLPR